MSTFRGHTGGLESAGACTDDHDLSPCAAGFLDDVRDGLFTPGGRIVNAQRLASLVDAIQAIGGADAGPDRMLSTFGHF